MAALSETAPPLAALVFLELDAVVEVAGLHPLVALGPAFDGHLALLRAAAEFPDLVVEPQETFEPPDVEPAGIDRGADRAALVAAVLAIGEAAMRASQYRAASRVRSLPRRAWEPHHEVCDV